MSNTEVIASVLQLVRHDETRCRNEDSERVIKAQLTQLLDGVLEREQQMLVDPLSKFLTSDKLCEQLSAVYVLGLLGPKARSTVPAMIKARDKWEAI
ncbi:MAG TPA: hypothetical protein V6D17_10785 [Candidatus Obscuribacterales bacterium]